MEKLYTVYIKITIKAQQMHISLATYCRGSDPLCQFFRKENQCQELAPLHVRGAEWISHSGNLLTGPLLLSTNLPTML